MLDGAIRGSTIPSRLAMIPATMKPQPKRFSRPPRAGETGSAESATGYYWGEKQLRPFVEKILERAEREGDERLALLATRFLR